MDFNIVKTVWVTHMLFVTVFLLGRIVGTCNFNIIKMEKEPFLTVLTTTVDILEVETYLLLTEFEDTDRVFYSLFMT